MSLTKLTIFWIATTFLMRDLDWSPQFSTIVLWIATVPLVLVETRDNPIERKSGVWGLGGLFMLVAFYLWLSS